MIYEPENNNPHHNLKELVGNLEILCHKINDMHGLLAIVSRGIDATNEYSSEYRKSLRLDVQAASSLRIIADYQDKISEASWDLFEELRSLIGESAESSG